MPAPTFLSPRRINAVTLGCSNGNRRRLLAAGYVSNATRLIDFLLGGRGGVVHARAQLRINPIRLIPLGRR